MTSSVLPAGLPDDYSVTWDTPGADFRDSMPIGNGDIGLNLWTQSNGEIVFLTAKTDAVTENSQLVKLGRVRLKLDPNPFAAVGFRQILRPRMGEIEIATTAGTTVRVWVDANAPVAHVEIESSTPISLQAAAELWRLQPRKVLQSARELSFGHYEQSRNPGGSVTIDPDTVLPAANNRVTWLHHNARSIYSSVFENQHLESLQANYPDPLLYRNFGVTMKGAGLVSAGDLTLRSHAPGTAFRLDLYALTNQSEHIEKWQAALEQTVTAVDSVEFESARAAHRRWCADFWDRSYVRVTGDADAALVTQGYAMQRWLAATSGRGALPLKFNGSLFTVGQEPAPETPYDPAQGQENADLRGWGSNYWFQNQRLSYAPMLAQGDFDTLAPFFEMYRAALPLSCDRVRHYYQHDGATFPETMFFWGLPNNSNFGWGNPGNEIANTYIGRHVNNGLELTVMLLDFYDATQDDAFARSTLLPLAEALVAYFDFHWKRQGGKIRFEPSSSLETRQTAVNPAPDIAGLMSVLPRLLALPTELTSPGQRANWQRLLGELPPLPRGRTDAEGKHPQEPQLAAPDGREILWAAQNYDPTKNIENPELYAVFPYRLFGVELPEFDLARATYEARRHDWSTSWSQDGIQAACLGWADKARAKVVAKFTAYGSQRFKWFWEPGPNWEPDLDNGGSGQLILQNMLMQTRGDQILLLPAWPREWNVEFRLHAPRNTVVEGVYRDSELVKLEVTPAERGKDIVRVEPQ